MTKVSHQPKSQLLEQVELEVNLNGLLEWMTRQMIDGETATKLETHQSLLPLLRLTNFKASRRKKKPLMLVQERSHQ
jgi:hypothetical protein